VNKKKNYDYSTKKEEGEFLELINILKDIFEIMFILSVLLLPLSIFFGFLLVYCCKYNEALNIFSFLSSLLFVSGLIYIFFLSMPLILYAFFYLILNHFKVSIILFSFIFIVFVARYIHIKTSDNREQDEILKIIKSEYL